MLSLPCLAIWSSLFPTLDDMLLDLLLSIFEKECLLCCVVRSWALISEVREERLLRDVCTEK